MKLQHWLKAGAISLGAIGLGMTINTFLPQRFLTDEWYDRKTMPPKQDLSTYPSIDISFLRCGSTLPIPEYIMTRGAFSLESRRNAHSAVLIRHPQATFLYDTGLSGDIYTFLMDQSFFFRNTLANFDFEQSLASHLDRLHMTPHDLDFALISHLHWDHVSGVADIPTVPLHINRVEYDAFQSQPINKHHQLIRALLCDNPIELFDCLGAGYEGFRSSYDLFGDNSIVLVPLPGHTPGNTGMFINRSNGPRVFLLGDAVWISENYLRPATMHPVIWSQVTSDDASARQTLIDLHRFAHRHPEISMIAMHDARIQEAFMRNG